MRGYWALGSSPKFLLLALASGIPFNGMFYMCCLPQHFSEHLKLEPTQFFWFFVLTISGIMGGAWLSGRLAGRIAPKRQIRHGFVIMFVVGIANVALNTVLAPHPAWALLPIAIFSSAGRSWCPWSRCWCWTPGSRTPRDGIIAAGFRGLNREWGGGGISVMHSALGLATAPLLMMCIGLTSWMYLHHRWPEIGSHAGVTPGG